MGCKKIFPEQSGQAHFNALSHQALRGVAHFAPPQHRYAVKFLIAACASLAKRSYNRKELSRISVTRYFLLYKKNRGPINSPLNHALIILPSLLPLQLFLHGLSSSKVLHVLLYHVLQLPLSPHAENAEAKFFQHQFRWSSFSR